MKKKLQQALASNLRLLVLIRESLRVEGAETSELFAAVANNVHMTGLLVPDDMKMTPDELAALRKGILAASKLPDIEASAKKLPSKPGESVILDPRQLGKHFPKPQ